MCNIAGYIGNKTAAPLLLDMLSREEYYDGGFSTGIATIHEGKIYYKKILGNVKDFRNQVDLSTLPGTVGIAHSRPANSYLEHAHPYISQNGKLASVCNGTSPTDYMLDIRTEVTNALFEKGYDFVTRHKSEPCNFPVLKNGDYVAPVDVIVNLAEYYIKEGFCFEEAQAKAVTDMYSERVCVMINEDTPDFIGVCRITRPMEIMMTKDESYIATTRFAFPQDTDGDVYTLPVLHTCRVKRGSFEVTPYKVGREPVAEITPATYVKAYNRICEMLTGAGDNQYVYDDLEIEMSKMPELWNEQNLYSQYAKVAYDVMWQLHMEGKLKQKIGTQEKRWGIRPAAYLYI